MSLCGSTWVRASNKSWSRINPIFVGQPFQQKSSVNRHFTPLHSAPSAFSSFFSLLSSFLTQDFTAAEQPCIN